MRQLNLPKKYTAMGQLWLSILLIVLAAIFAFTPIISLDMSESSLWNGIESALDSLEGSIPGLEDIKAPEDEVGVTSFKVITSVSILAKVISVAINSATHDADAEKKADELAELLKSEEGQESILMMVALVAQLIDFDTAFEEPDETAKEEESSGGIGMVIETIMKFIIVFYLILYITVWPFILAVIAVINLIRALGNIHTPENVAGKVGGVLVSPFAFALTLSFLLTFLPGFQWGSGLTVVFVCAIISIVANTVLTRLRAYNSMDFRFANLVQGAALLQGVGFIVFFSNLLKTDLLFKFFNSLGNYMIDAGNQIAIVNGFVKAHNRVSQTDISEATLGVAYLPDLLLMIAFFALALGVIGTITKAVICRLTLTTDKKVGPNAPLSSAIMALVVSIIPFVVASFESKRKFVWDSEAKNWMAEKLEENASILVLDSANKGALTGMIVGAVIMLIAAIGFKIAKNYICGGMNDYQEMAVLSGNAPAYVADGAEEAAPAEAEKTEEADA